MNNTLPRMSISLETRRGAKGLAPSTAGIMRLSRHYGGRQSLAAELQQVFACSGLPVDVLCALLLTLALPLTAVAGPEIALVTAKAWTNQAASPLNLPGLPNAFKVSDNLYRGAQPAAEGFKELKKLGIKTVLCLRAFHSDADADAIAGAGLLYEQIPIHTWNAKEEDVVRFLQIVTDTNKTPVFVHCQHGADRTGAMVAVYRMALCGWKKDDAVDEMVHGGFGFHKTWENLITFLKNLDIEAVKKKAGLTTSQ